MAKRSGILAELNRQAKAAERRKRQRERESYRAMQAAAREAERTEREAQKLLKQYERATAQAQRETEKAAKRLHQESREAEVEARNAELEMIYQDIDGLLQATLEVDDYIDLETLKPPPVEHPPFDPGDLARPTPPPGPLTYPPEPAFTPPAPPKGLAKLGSGKKHQAAVGEAQSAHMQAVAEWRRHCEHLYQQHLIALNEHQKKEQQRQLALDDAYRQYHQECQQREQQAAALRASIDDFANQLAFDVESAIEEYVGLVLSNSVYPDSFPVEHEYSFDLKTRELSVRVLTPPPAEIPQIKAYKYVKARDEITHTDLSMRERKTRYNNAIWQVAIRTVHEVFEADRQGKIVSIVASVDTRFTDPATGRLTDVTFVSVGASRETFVTFDLSQVEPDACLKHLGAALSKDPYSLVPADSGPGIRQQGR